MDIPRDKHFPEDSVQCDNCGGLGCIDCNFKGWFASSDHPKGRKCAREECGKPLAPYNLAIYCSDECAALDA